MPTNKQPQTPLHYSRKKNNVEISGDPDDVKKLAWFDLCTSRVAWIVILLLFLLSKLGVVQQLGKWVKAALAHFTLLFIIIFLLNLSG